jgi:predicted  nucleic acid-binding Zn-ribbon protein
VSDEPESIVLRYLRRIDMKQDQLATKMDEVIMRLGSLERDVAGLKVDFAGLQVSMDNFDRRVTRIETRLELLGTHDAH